MANPYDLLAERLTDLIKHVAVSNDALMNAIERLEAIEEHLGLADYELPQPSKPRLVVNNSPDDAA